MDPLSDSDELKLAMAVHTAVLQGAKRILGENDIDGDIAGDIVIALDDTWNRIRAAIIPMIAAHKRRRATDDT